MSADWSTPDATLVLTVEAAEDRAIWLAQRRKGIGGSDAAALMGEGRYATEYDVWLDKTGRSTEREQTLAMELGTRWEAAVAEKFCDDTGLTVRRRGLMRSKSHPHLVANVDRLTDDGGVLECKAVNQFTRMPKDERHANMPADWYWQLVTYLLVTGRKTAWLAVAIGNTGWETRTFSRKDDQVQLDMNAIAIVVEPWWYKHVDGDELPPMNELAKDVPDEIPKDQQYEFFIPEAGLALRDELRELRQAKKDIDAQEKALKKKLAAESGGARWLMADGKPILQFNPRKGRASFQKAALFKNQPVPGGKLVDLVHELFPDEVDDDKVSRIIAWAIANRLTEEQFTTRGAPSSALLIVGDADE